MNERKVPIPQGLAVAFTLFAMIWSADIANAHPSHGFGRGALFHGADIDAALEVARSEHKLVFVYVTAKGGAAPNYLMRPTVREWRTIDLLIQESVAVLVDSERHRLQLSRFMLEEPPIVLLLENDGKIIRTMPGEISAEELLSELTFRLSDEGALERAKQSVAENAGDPLAHERLAEAYRRAGDLDAAAKEYLWCCRKGLRENLPYAAIRRRVVAERFVSLSAQSKAAKELLQGLIDELVNLITEKQDDPNLARDLAELHCFMGERELTFALFNRLPGKSRARYALLDYVIEQLTHEGRYEEVLRFGDPLILFAQEVAWVARLRGQKEEDGVVCVQRGTVTFAVRRGAALVEALAGAGHLNDARQLADQVLGFSKADETKAMLIESAKQANSEELLVYLQPRK